MKAPVLTRTLQVWKYFVVLPHRVVPAGNPKLSNRGIYCSVWLGCETSLFGQVITKGNGFQFNSDSVFDWDHGMRLEDKRRQH